MKTANQRLSVLLLLTALGLAGCATPGETRASYILQGDVQNMINANEIAQGRLFGGKVVDTKVLSDQAGTITEAWYVKRGGRTVKYTVEFTPSPGGGTDFVVTLPEEDRQSR